MGRDRTGRRAATPSLTEFLLARIDEDEAVAREAIDRDRPGTHWQWAAPDDVADTDAPRWLRTVEEFPTSSGVGPLPAFPLGFEFKAAPARGMDHIARHDPARVLAECEAKRQVVMDPGFRESGRTTLSIFGERVLGRMAAVYADHPDYRAAAQQGGWAEPSPQSRAERMGIADSVRRFRESAERKMRDLPDGV